MRLIPSRLARNFAVLLGVLALSACGSADELHSYNFRMTVEVETPEGVRSGSSVYAVTAASAKPLLQEQAGRSWEVRGEAVAVDLPNGKTVFALLKTGAHFGDLMGLSMNTLYPTFREDGYDVVGVAGKLSQRKPGGEPATVAPDDYPMLVAFEDINNPASVYEVDPADLAASFGEGVTLRQITVELTGDPVTTGIEERLRLIGIKPDHSLDNDFEMTTSPTLAQILSHRDFVQGTVR